MTAEIWLVCGQVLVTLVLFARDRVPVDAVAVGVLLALTISGLVSVEEGLAGFSNPATVIVAAMFVLSAGLRRTGALASIGALLGRLGRRSDLLALSVLMVVVAVTIAASMSFLTPVGYQTNTMISAPGNYGFSDFVRIGGPLGLIVTVAATLLIPVFWPF